MWENILGHKDIKCFLEQYIARKEKPHALLFVGPAGLGKKKMAEEFSRSLLCFTGSGRDACDSCRQLDFESGNISHPDFIHIARELNPTTGKLRDISIEQVRELQSKTAFGPVLSRYKVCLIEDVDRMRAEAANCLLKVLEEPPEGWILILLAEAEEKLLSTILSRVVVLRFHSLPFQEAAAVVKEKCSELSLEQAQVLVQISDGSIGKAVALQEQKFWECRKLALDLLEAFPIAAPVNYFADRAWIDKMERSQALLLVNVLQLLLRDLLFLSSSLQQNLYNSDIKKELQALAKGWNYKTLKRSLPVLDEAYCALEGNAGIKLVLEAMTLKIDKISKE